MKKRKIQVPLFDPSQDTPNVFANLNYDGKLQHWKISVFRLVDEAIEEIAKDRNANPAEIAKVAQYLIELAMPDSRGRKPKYEDPVLVMEIVAAQMSRGSTQSQACELVGVSPRTFRDIKSKYSKDWASVEKHVRYDSRAFRLNVKGKEALTPSQTIDAKQITKTLIDSWNNGS